ncbi:MAG: ribosomal protein L6, large subunit ribosomal protein L6 [Candidatus Amesbacteria bacterium GW2011_GWC1_47_15]|uniref:50S ribosomal protein L6 n=4 Tax=Candidatus Amesiibacteriota TaxID=1752730 RepID=A0A1F4ZXI5_9BACT|nr:MAG: ribosomal protein L6, large subunit ribosomal protein L6 [Candidatus Amesbacteria bacterium GW2011_GWC1_47_15]KKU96782.1 MAG: 50S ribosomal protein L6 [Candidatus Amesbacteria bacterium GW2011_GWB1_48_13]OGD10167.1 MAG: 50S ribosomal protein L6 [Candidatus Amesbacteria bacterium RIFOXYB1_FULL_47_9]
MARMAKIPIKIPTGVTVTAENRVLTVTGPKGQLSWNMPPDVAIILAENEAKVTHTADGETNLVGLTWAYLSNMVRGVTEGWGKVLELSGTGFRATTSGTQLDLALGFSHPIKVTAPAGITFEVKENKITIKGSDKELVGEIAARIRALRPADPYKAKGFKYENEVIVRKAGKAAKAGGVK